MGQLFDICDRQDIYRVRRFEKMIEELDAENTKGDNGKNFRGDLHP